jgi:acetoin:2,6-dichlorophenolindophenol oxidoreductase subunit beta
MRTRMSYIAAIGAAQLEAMKADERVIVIGEDVEANVYGTTGGSRQRAEEGDFVQMFGRNRVRNTPISEETIVGATIGAAMTGLRPIVDLSYSSFLYLAMDQFVNQAAKSRYMFGGQGSIPVVFRSAMFYSLNTGAHHSDRPYPMFMNVPGLKIIAPASPTDAKGLLRAAVDSDDPVLMFEAVPLWGLKEEVEEDEYRIPLGEARTVREGGDATVVAISGSVVEAVAAADALGEEGISVEVIDPRTLVPLDTAAILRSVEKTGRLVVAEPAHRTCGAAAEISAMVVEEAYGALRAPIVRITAPDMQIPFSPALESLFYPDREKIAAAVRRVCGEVEGPAPEGSNGAPAAFADSQEAPR